AGDHRQPAAGQVHVHVLEVVLARAAHADEFGARGGVQDVLESRSTEHCDRNPNYSRARKRPTRPWVSRCHELEENRPALARPPAPSSPAPSTPQKDSVPFAYPSTCRRRPRSLEVASE